MRPPSASPTTRGESRCTPWSSYRRERRPQSKRSSIGAETRSPGTSSPGPSRSSGRRRCPGPPRARSCIESSGRVTASKRDAGLIHEAPSKSGAKGVPHHVHAHGPAGAVEPDLYHIEPAGPIAESPPDQVCGCQLDQRPLLLEADGLRRGSIGHRPAGLDLDKDEV